MAPIFRLTAGMYTLEHCYSKLATFRSNTLTSKCYYVEIRCFDFIALIWGNDLS